MNDEGRLPSSSLAEIMSRKLSVFFQVVSFLINYNTIPKQ